YGVHSVANGREVLEALTRIQYDLILMDCQMPEMDGFQATREIRAFESTLGRHIPIIAMTANAHQEDREQCLSVGMDDFLTKPIRLQDLQGIIEKWIGKKSAVGSIDWNILDDLVQKTNVQVVQRLIESFQQTLPRILAGMEQAYGEQNVDQLKKL